MCPRFAVEGRRGWYFPARGNATVLGRSVASAWTGGAGRRLAPERRPQRRPFVVVNGEARPARGEVRVVPGILASGPPVEEAQSIADVIDMCRHRGAAVRTGARLCCRARIERVVQTAI